MILAAVAASLKDRLFLNQATRTVPILLVTEENPRTLRLELDRAGLTDATNLHIIPFASFAGLPWPQLAQRIERACRDLNIGWLILDTFYSVVGLGGDEENKAGAVDEAIAPLRRLAGKLDIAITLLRHARKAGGEVGTSGRGSSALTGAVDIVGLLKRSFGKASTRRQLEVTGRVEQVTLHVELRDQAYVVVDLSEQTEDEVHHLDHAISADPMASARELAKLTGIGRNRIESVAAKSGWRRSNSGWSRAGT